MSHEQWKRAWLYGRTIECFHCLGLLQHIAITFYDFYSYRYQDFYWKFITWMEDNPYTVAGSEFRFWQKLLDESLMGGSWDCVDPRFGNVSWPPEEFAFLQICRQKRKFYDELNDSCNFLSGFTLDEQEEMIQGPELGKEEEWARTAVWYGRKGTRKYLKKKSNVQASV